MEIKLSVPKDEAGHLTLGDFYNSVDLVFKWFRDNSFEHEEMLAKVLELYAENTRDIEKDD